MAARGVLEATGPVAHNDAADVGSAEWAGFGLAVALVVGAADFCHALCQVRMLDARRGASSATASNMCVYIYIYIYKHTHIYILFRFKDFLQS